uniref:Guanylate cyclase n=1 Tax=Parastrongyloides trichosuri TaxID=131310 RepID=A0A0N4ZDR2_PARTI
MGYQNSASAISIAINRTRKENPVLERINITAHWSLIDCNAVETAGMLYELITVHDIDVLLGPPCQNSIVVASNIASYFKLLTLFWGNSFLSYYNDNTVHPTIGSVMGTYEEMSTCLGTILRMYNWTTVSVLYQSSDSELNRCIKYVEQQTNTFSQHFQNIITVYQKNILKFNDENLNEIADAVRQVSRIIIICFDDMENERKLMLKFYDKGMNNSDYVYINVDSDMDAYINDESLNALKDYSEPNDGRDKEAFSMYQWMYHFQFSMSGGENYRYEEIRRDIVSSMKDKPFYCTTECESYNESSIFAPYLYDAAYIYFSVVAEVIKAKNLTNVTDISGELVSKYLDGTFEGVTGKFTITKNLTRLTNTMLCLYTDDGNNVTNLIELRVKEDGVEVIKFFTDPKDSIWFYRDGKQPLNVPKCGYMNELCPLSFIEQSPLRFAGILVALLIFIFVTIGILSYYYYLKQKEIEAQNSLWKINIDQVSKYSDYLKTESSKQSRISMDSSQKRFESYIKCMDKGKHQLYMYKDEIIVGKGCPLNRNFNNKDMQQLRNLKLISHENLNKFIGFYYSGIDSITFWGFCARLSLIDIFYGDNKTFSIDSFFMHSLIKDTVEGLQVIHKSQIKIHGNLTSRNCLVDERWKLKLSDFGLEMFRKDQKKDPEYLLWTAPELLRGDVLEPNEKTDIYSLAIVMSDILNNNISFLNTGINGGADEIIYMLKTKRHSFLRPEINPIVDDIVPAKIHLIKEMWSEDPSTRPGIDIIRTLIKEMHPDKSKSLMDYVFSMLENYAATLEEDIQERTKELIEEKKKADILLSRMLPKQVSEKLKLGQKVEPEYYDSVTIFFSDIVSFTTLASKCTPLQVVDLLNGLYTLFDSSINEYDVYKVETIGDGYMCVSGLPNKNGYLHVKEISCLSITLVKKLPEFKISHLPYEVIKVRIGIHSGSCVAGVVGLTMPRYCLFGDTVNTASRMESSGLGNHIHLSSDANNLLTKEFTNFVTKPRGEIIVKGKGVMETFWLLGLHGDTLLNISE